MDIGLLDCECLKYEIRTVASESCAPSVRYLLTGYGVDLVNVAMDDWIAADRVWVGRIDTVRRRHDPLAANKRSTAHVFSATGHPKTAEVRESAFRALQYWTQRIRIATRVVCHGQSLSGSQAKGRRQCAASAGVYKPTDHRVKDISPTTLSPERANEREDAESNKQRSVVSVKPIFAKHSSLLSERGGLNRRRRSRNVFDDVGRM